MDYRKLVSDFLQRQADLSTEEANTEDGEQLLNAVRDLDVDSRAAQGAKTEDVSSSGVRMDSLDPDEDAQAEMELPSPTGMLAPDMDVLSQTQPESGDAVPESAIIEEIEAASPTLPVAEPPLSIAQPELNTPDDGVEASPSFSESSRTEDAEVISRIAESGEEPTASTPFTSTTNEATAELTQSDSTPDPELNLSGISDILEASPSERYADETEHAVPDRPLREDGYLPVQPELESTGSHATESESAHAELIVSAGMAADAEPATKSSGVSTEDAAVIDAIAEVGRDASAASMERYSGEEAQAESITVRDLRSAEDIVNVFKRGNHETETIVPAELASDFREMINNVSVKVPVVESIIIGPDADSSMLQLPPMPTIVAPSFEFKSRDFEDWGRF